MQNVGFLMTRQISVERIMINDKLNKVTLGWKNIENMLTELQTVQTLLRLLQNYGSTMVVQFFLVKLIGLLWQNTR